jgi:hypothetical protein
MSESSPDLIVFRRLEKADNRNEFDCGVAVLNEYLKEGTM